MPEKARWVAALANPGKVPPELAYVAIAERLGISPLDVLDMPEHVMEDVMLYYRAAGAEANARQQRRLLNG